MNNREYKSNNGKVLIKICFIVDMLAINSLNSVLVASTGELNIFIFYLYINKIYFNHTWLFILYFYISYVKEIK